MGVASCFEDNEKRAEDAAFNDRPTDPELAAILAAPRTVRKAPAKVTHVEKSILRPPKKPKMKLKRLRRSGSDRRTVIGQSNVRVSDLIERIRQLEAENLLLRSLLTKQADELRKRRAR